MLPCYWLPVLMFCLASSGAFCSIVLTLWIVSWETPAILASSFLVSTFSIFMLSDFWQVGFSALCLLLCVTANEIFSFAFSLLWKCFHGCYSPASLLPVPFQCPFDFCQSLRKCQQQTSVRFPHSRYDQESYSWPTLVLRRPSFPDTVPHIFASCA